MAIDGSFDPSRYSRKAPPPVEIYDISLVTSKVSIAEMVSPPPAIEKPVFCAIAFAIASVPTEKFLNSKTPTGPFQIIVFIFAIVSILSLIVSGPISKIISSEAISLTDFMTRGSLGLKFFAVATSIGSGMLVSDISFFARGIKLGS